MAGFPMSRGSDPRVNSLYLSNGSGLYQLHRRTIKTMGMDLIAHASDDFGLGCLQPHLSCLPNRMREGLLAEYVFAPSHGVQAHPGVHVVGDAHGDGVHLVTNLGKHLAVVLENRRVWVKLTRFGGAGEVHVAECNVLGFGMAGHSAYV